MNEENFIEIKYRELAEIGLSKEYEGLYISEKNETLREVFSTLHHHIIGLCKSLNSRLPTGEFGAHFGANQSRLLIQIINITFELYNSLKNTRYAFSIDSQYNDLFIKCNNFLNQSGGSQIPPNMEKITLYYVYPIFIVSDTIIISDDNSTRYCELRNIGDGSYATVFRYKDPMYDKFFALKRAKSELTEKELVRFRNEFETMKKLSSPYILEVFKYNESRNEYSMEYMDCTLYEYISANNTNLSKDQRKGIARQILKAFSHIHCRNLLHRDISFKNILVKKFDEIVVIKVADFGLVKIPDSTLTAVDTEFKGMFNDPSLRTEGFVNYDMLHETYALTLLIYFVMTGKTNTEKINDNSLHGFVMKGLNPNKKQRFQNVGEIISALKDI